MESTILFSSSETDCSAVMIMGEEMMQVENPS